MSAAAPSVVELTRELVRFDTTNPPGNERPAVERLEALLAGCGFETRLVPYGEPSRAQLVARLRGTGEAPGLLFSGHVDVVPVGEQPWSVPPFGGEVREGRLYGRGACDMKGGVAALVVAACRLAASGPLRGDLVLALTADEERNCLGAEALVQEPLFDGLGSVLVAEPTALRLYTAEKGALWLEVTFAGRTAHGSMPHLGANAAMAMADLLVRWERAFPREPVHPLLGAPTMSVGIVQGGVKVNVVPDRCVAEIDVRTVPPLTHAELVARAEALIAEVCAERPGIRGALRVRSDRPPVHCPEDTPLARAVAAALREMGIDPTPRGIPYCTEASIWVPRLGIPAVICGPGEPGMAHQPDEWTETAELERAVALYEGVARALLGSPAGRSPRADGEPNRTRVDAPGSGG